MDDWSYWLAELTCGEDERAEMAVPHLATQGETVLPDVLELTSSIDVDTRWWALRLLSEWDSPFVIETLIQALSDSDMAVRECAALGLHRHPREAAVPSLINALDDLDHLVADLASDALIDIGSPAVSALLEVMENGEHRARLGAIRALALIGDNRAIPDLVKALDGSSMLMEFWANEGLERMGVGMQFFIP